jgi:hypothetical protein
LGKKSKWLVGFLIFICIFSGLVVYVFTSGPLDGPGGPERDYWGMTRVTNLEFIDGSYSNDTVVATVMNSADAPLSITSGYIVQYYWLSNGFVYRNHEQAAELFGDLTVPANDTRDIQLSLPSDTLTAGKTYAVELNTTQQNSPSMTLGNQNSFNTISASKPYTFYHMFHPNTPSSVEEGVITSLNAAFCDSNYADSMSATVQNTGDSPITITGGLVNGRGAINATDSSIHLTSIEQCVIEKNATGSVTLNFPAGTLYYTRQNPFNVKLVTAEGNLIECADMCYFDFPVSGRIRQTLVVKEDAKIVGVRFSHLSGNNGALLVTIHNSGSCPIDILSGLVNGKAATILSGKPTIDAGSTETLTLPAGTLVSGSKYQVVLISAQNNAFVTSTTYISS